jgi:hypothetical protein
VTNLLEQAINCNDGDRAANRAATTAWIRNFWSVRRFKHDLRGVDHGDYFMFVQALVVDGHWLDFMSNAPSPSPHVAISLATKRGA